MAPRAGAKGLPPRVSGRGSNPPAAEAPAEIAATVGRGVLLRRRADLGPGDPELQHHVAPSLEVLSTVTARSLVLRGGG